MPPYTRDKTSTLCKVLLVCAFFVMLDKSESVIASENISIAHIEESCIQKCPDHVSEFSFLYYLEDGARDDSEFDQSGLFFHRTIILSKRLIKKLIDQNASNIYMKYSTFVKLFRLNYPDDSFSF